MKKRKSKFLWATRENPCFRKRAIIRADPNLYPILSEHRWLDIRAVRKFRNLQRFPRAETRNCMLISRFRFILERNVTFFHANNIDRRVLSFLLILEFFSFSNDQLWGIFDGNSSPLFETRWIVGQPFEERGSLEILCSLGFPAIPWISRGFVLSLTVSPEDLSAFWTFSNNHWKWI